MVQQAADETRKVRRLRFLEGGNIGALQVAGLKHFGWLIATIMSGFFGALWVAGLRHKTHLDFILDHP